MSGTRGTSIAAWAARPRTKPCSVPPQPGRQMTSILLLATAWGPRHGGVNAFNQDFAIGLADVLASNGKVYCAVLRPTPQDQEAASCCGVTLINVDRDPTSSRYDPAWALEIRDQLRLMHGDPRIDWWVGHDLISMAAALRGREAANCGGVAAIKQMMQWYKKDAILPPEPSEALVASLRWEIARSLSEPSAHEALNRHRGPTEHHLTEPVVVRTGSSIDQLGAVTAQAILRGLSS